MSDGDRDTARDGEESPRRVEAKTRAFEEYLVDVSDWELDRYFETF